MNSRERLRRCYFHEELDRPGVYTRTGFPEDDPTYDALKKYLDEHTELKRGWSVQQCETSYNTEIKVEPHTEDFERHIITIKTPQGDIEKTKIVSLKGQPGLSETYYLKTREDAEKYLSLPIPEIGGNASSFFELDKEIGDKGIVEAGLGMNPGGHAAELFGSENFALMSVTDRDIIHALLQRHMQVIMNRVKFAIQNKVGPFFSMLGQEYIVPPLHGPKDFSDFNVEYDKPVIDLIHEAGGRIHVHSHGSIKTVLHGFLDMGVDVLHPFEPPPMGDITPSEAKEAVRGKICIEGNIQIAYMYEHTPEQIRQETKQLIKDTFDDNRGLIVCPTASPYLRGEGERCFPQYKAMIDTVLGR